MPGIADLATVDGAFTVAGGTFDTAAGLGGAGTVASAGTGTVLNVNGDLTAATVNVGPGSTMTVNGACTNGGTVAVGDGSTMTVNGAYTGAGATTLAGTLNLDAGGPCTYDGTIDMTAGSGVLRVTSGTVTMTGAITGGEGLPLQPTLNWEADEDPAGDDLWQSYYNGAALNVNNSTTWTFTGGAQTPVGVGSLQFGTVANAYAFPDGVATTVSLEELTGVGSNPDQNDHTFEFVLRPDDLVGDEVLLEMGGATNGMIIKLLDDQVQYVCKAGGNIASVSYTLSGDVVNDFHQLVAVYDKNMDADNHDRLALYFDGALVAEDATQTGVNDVAGTNDSGLGTANSEAPAGGGDDFGGQIALLRYYYNQALTPDQILANYNILAGTRLEVADGATLNADGGFTSLAKVSLGGTLNVGATSDAGIVTGTSGTAAMSVASGATLDVSALLDISEIDLADATAALNLNGGASNVGAVTGTGRLTIAAGASLATEGPASSTVDTLDNAGSLTTGANFTVGTLDNAGSLTTGANFTVDTLDNAGSLTVGADTTFTVGTALTQLVGTTLTAGSYTVGDNATLDLPGTASILMVNADASVMLEGTGTMEGIADVTTIAGALGIDSGATFTTAGTLNNTGSLLVGDASTLTVTGVYTGTGTVALDGLMELQAPASSANGAITGTGTLGLGAGVNFTVNANSSVGRVIGDAGSTAARWSWGPTLP